MKRALVLVPLLAFGFAFVVEGVTITDVTTSTTVFKDDFETGTFSPSVGSWSVGPDVTVTNSPMPGAAQGSFYAQLFRNSNNFSQGNLNANLSSVQATPGDLIRLDMMVYLPSATDTSARVQFMLTDGDFNSARAWLQSDGTGNVLAIGPGFAATDTGLNYLTDTWQLWELSYVIGSSTFNVSINGAQATGFSSFTTGEVRVANLFNGNPTPAGSFFLDGVVPEPSTWALLLSGSALLLAVVRTRTRRTTSDS
ncbi:MAG: PEP-CTERM sorting domain-containing protein [Chthoniobacterales bacterium]